ncbi:hypothetical protein [Halodesulfovibrio spirochaetisodalis]|uniref:Uncharacterized protein n=1 Tax=Halodesulfovibrio spirochaetisodalis TaxID=1560234 RepID=A0A1B7XH89_9BACT|nr:hypothetical protein [Halodesulfovibrio spirochaetisodalis]OBQ54887.1 hypothetical protein SP90_05260 [Halodesulfovibrio spirochaetisodalis]
MAVTEFSKAVKSISEVLIFENWLRFYFISEEDEGKLFIRIPEKADMRIRENWPHIHSLADELNNKEITPETSREAVIVHISNELDGNTMKPGMAERVLSSVTFQFEMHLFSMWVEGHEEQLDQSFLDFGNWLSMYSEWKQTDKVKQYIDEAREKMKAAEAATATDTTEKKQ